MADKKPTTKAPKAKATKKAEEVKTIEQLRDDLAAKQADQIAAKRGHAAGELTNPRVLTHTRKEIARLHTAIRAAEIADAKESK
ncbi:MAG TPA: 50S ribosomal protein L29 [Candidatus Saccharimonadales bacterium]|nr:50S ribosomal protein L29 [Candidatus Saccharimonadales bacterium]